MKVNVYYSDLAIFAGLKELLTRYPKTYRVIEYCNNFMVVEWDCTLGEGGTKLRNLEYINPYKQAERIAKGEPIIIC